MSLVIGLDTGGTYTDAALFDVDQGVVRTTAKALTTREDLSIGLGVAIVKVLADMMGNLTIFNLCRYQQRWPPTPWSRVLVVGLAYS